MENRTVYIIGMGLRGIKSLTQEQVEVLKISDVICVDTYTSIFPEGISRGIKLLTGHELEFLDRQNVESFSFLNRSFKTLSLIVSGDPMSSTTHFAIIEKCRELNIYTKIMENASIVTVIPGRTGLSPYRMGPTISIPQVEGNFLPKSVAKKIRESMERGLHSLLLIDLDDGKNLSPERVHEILHTLGDGILPEIFYDMPIFVLERVGWNDEHVFVSTVNELRKLQNRSPYCLVLPVNPGINELTSMRALGVKPLSVVEEFDYNTLSEMSTNKTKEY